MKDEKEILVAAEIGFVKMCEQGRDALVSY